MDARKVLKTNKILLYFSGVNHLLVVILHLFFWKLFNWSEQLQLLTVVNSNIMQMLNYGIAILFIGFAYLILFQQTELLNTKLGKIILVLLSIFWFARFIMEFAFPEGSPIFALFLLLVTLSTLVPAITSTYKVAEVNMELS